jgi:uncharacterized protein (TIGR03067 family)
MKSRVLLLPAVVLLLGADAKEDAAKKDRERLQGTWSVVSAERGGEKVPEAQAQKMKLEIKGDTVTVQTGKGSEEATFKLDPTQKPAAIDITSAEKKWLGIYQLEGDALKVCWSDGDQRPTEFASKAGTRIRFMTLKRDKP